MIALAAESSGDDRKITARLLRPIDDIQDVAKIADELHQWDAWTVDRFLFALAHKRCVGIVAIQAGVIVGYAICERFEQALTILNFGVSCSQDRKAITNALIESLKRQLVFSHWMRTIEFIVEDSNLPIQLVMREQGFKAVMVLRDFFDMGDGYVFQISKSVAAESAIQERFGSLKQ